MKFVVELDEATPMTLAISRGLSDRTRVHRVIANAALPEYQRNFVRMSATNHNSFGVRSSFWNRMLSGTTAEADESAATIRMPREVALRYYGGTVTPVNATLLAIPARSEAYGKSPRDFSDLRLAVFMKAGGGKTFALVQRDQQKINYGRKRRDGTRSVTPGAEAGGGVFYWLVPSATINPDKTVLPLEEKVLEAIEIGMDGYLHRLAVRRN